MKRGAFVASSLIIALVLVPMLGLGGQALAEHAGWLPPRRISIVWPHDERGQSASKDHATFVNIGFDIFAHGTLNSVPIEYSPRSLTLLVAKGNDSPVALYELPAEKSIYVANGHAFPRWAFNNVPVQPGEQYHGNDELRYCRGLMAITRSHSVVLLSAA